MAYQPETGLQKFMKSKAAPYVGMLLVIVLGLLFAYSGLFGEFCIGVLLMGILMYVLPKAMGANTKQLAVFGIVFFVVLTAFGGYFISKPAMLSYDEVHTSGNSNDLQNYYSNIVVTPFRGDDGTYTFTVDYSGNIDTGAGQALALRYGVVDHIYFTNWEGPLTDIDKSPVVSGTTYTFEVTLSDGNAYCYRFAVVDAGNNEVSGTASANYIGPVTMSDSQAAVFGMKWCAYTILPTVIFFFLIVILTAWMRKSLEKTRERLEREGRLYPQGYGRCKDCGTIVLPGEVVCRKCGAYVDVPQEMKPNKVEFFECSECGKEVPSNADACPSCGAKFDGTEEISEDPKQLASDQTFTCSECKKEVPADADVCPHCGEKFEE